MVDCTQFPTLTGFVRIPPSPVGMGEGFGGAVFQPPIITIQNKPIAEERLCFLRQVIRFMTIGTASLTGGSLAKTRARNEIDGLAIALNRFEAGKQVEPVFQGIPTSQIKQVNINAT